MSHYFTTPTGEENRRLVDATIWGRDYSFVTANGVFSGTRLDPGTAVLLRSVDPPSGAGRFLDVGCGFGPIAVALATEAPEALVDAVDVNERALQLTRLNADRLGVGERVRTLRPDDVEPNATYDEIWSNPPIRIGKDALHELLLTWLARLSDDGVAWLVVGKNLGADSLQRWLIDQGYPTEKQASAKGYRVLRAARS